MSIELRTPFTCKGVAWRLTRPTNSTFHISRIHTINFIVYRRGQHVRAHLRDPYIVRPYPKKSVGESKWYAPHTWGDMPPRQAVRWAMERVVMHEQFATKPNPTLHFLPKECRDEHC